MTHVTHPYGQRLGIIKTWKSSWFSDDRKTYIKYLKSDFLIREFLYKKLSSKGLCDLTIERGSDNLVIKIFTFRPGLVVGKSGSGIESLTKEIKQLIAKNKLEAGKNVKVQIEDVKYAETSAVGVADMIITGFTKRLTARRILKQTIEKVIANQDVQGVKIAIAGRLGGAEIARREHLKRGRIPLQTLRADIDYASVPYIDKYGTLGIKVWIYKGDIFKEKKK